MPYVCDNSQLSWTDDDEPISPTASDFVYLPAKELGGPSGPAKLRIPTGSEPNNSEEFENPQEARALHLSLKASGVAKVYCQYDRHRALRHHSEGIFLCEGIFGATITNSDGKQVPVRTIGEQHVKDDLGWIPSVKDWLQHIELQPWMGRTVFRPQHDADQVTHA